MHTGAHTQPHIRFILLIVIHNLDYCRYCITRSVLSITFMCLRATNQIYAMRNDLSKHSVKKHNTTVQIDHIMRLAWLSILSKCSIFSNWIFCRRFSMKSLELYVHNVNYVLVVFLFCPELEHFYQNMLQLISRNIVFFITKNFFSDKITFEKNIDFPI